MRPPHSASAICITFSIFSRGILKKQMCVKHGQFVEVLPISSHFILSFQLLLIMISFIVNNKQIAYYIDVYQLKSLKEYN